MLTIRYFLNGVMVTWPKATPMSRPSNKRLTYTSFEGMNASSKIAEREGDYALGLSPPRYLVPALLNHLDLIAAEPMEAFEDFSAIGWYGRHYR